MNLEAALFNATRRVALTGAGNRALDFLLRPFNPFSARRYNDPYPLYDDLRNLGRLYWHRRVRMWLVTGYEETVQVLRGPVSVDRSDMVTGFDSYRDMNPTNANLMLSNMLMQDPPDHTRLRRTVNRGFTPRSVAVMDRRITESANRAVAELHDIGQDAFDIMPNVRALPIRMICDLVGIPDELRTEMVSIADTLAQFADPLTGFDAGVMDAAVERLRTMTTELAKARRAEPMDDLISTLVAPDGDDNGLSDDEVISMVGLLIIAGQETTSGFVGNALVALSQSPSQRSWLKQEAAVESAVEELLRFDSPIQATDRTVVEDFTVGGKQLKRGQVVVLYLGAANRDPAHYDKPHQLRLDRPDVRPLAFGHGVHHCLGAAMAKKQAGALLSAFVATFPEYAVAPNGVSWKRSTTLRGPSSLRLELGRPA